MKNFCEVYELSQYIFRLIGILISLLVKDSLDRRGDVNCLTKEINISEKFTVEIQTVHVLKIFQIWST
jgi:hypothetical protein